MLSPFSQLSFTAALVLFFAGTLLDAKSVIVDDTDTSKITYSSGWLTGNTCTGCFAQPDKTQAFDSTWHDVTATGTAEIFFTFTFTGTSVEARYIAIDIIETAFTFTTGTNVSYSIDGVKRGTAVRNPINATSYVYNQRLFNVTGLDNVEHTLRVDLLTPSVLLLDYLIYEDGGEGTSTVTASLGSGTSTTPSSTPSSTSSTPSTKTGPIIGGVVAALAILVLGAVIIWFFLKRRRRRQASQRRALPILESEDIKAIPPSRFLSPGAQSTSIAGTTQTGQTFNPPQSASSHTPTYTSSATGSNVSRAPLRATNLTHTASNSITSSTPPPSSPGMTNLSSLPSLPELHHGPWINEKAPAGRPRQDRTAGRSPPSNFYPNVVGNLVQAEVPNEPDEPDEPVEQGLMSRHASTVTTLPPYSPGAFPRDGNAPMIPR